MGMEEETYVCERSEGKGILSPLNTVQYVLEKKIVFTNIEILLEFSGVIESNVGKKGFECKYIR